MNEKVFVEFLKRCNEKESLEIPELGITVYYKPVTVLEMDKIFAMSGGGASTKDFHVFTWIEKIEDENGFKIFSVEDRPYIEKLPWALVSRVSNIIHKATPVNELKKSSNEMGS